MLLKVVGDLEAVFFETKREGVSLFTTSTKNDFVILSTLSITLLIEKRCDLPDA